jgi:hypothetical protein
MIDIRTSLLQAMLRALKLLCYTVVNGKKFKALLKLYHTQGENKNTKSLQVTTKRASSVALSIFIGNLCVRTNLLSLLLPEYFITSEHLLLFSFYFQ